MMGSSGCGKTTLISCLVNIGSLDSGEISIFGEPAKNLNKSRVGYMPQESALINGFTVREMVWFFGTIFGMDYKKINERFYFLKSLLELPSEDRLIRDCSGGQQRRISFALSLVHEPELLILDEPTVGVDPLLRSKIWNYLMELTKTKNVTVLLSTHYIEEARQSNCVGVIRNGLMIAEDSPTNILINCETSSLEEAFLRLSERQEADIFNQNDHWCGYKKLSSLESESSAVLQKKSRILPTRHHRKQETWRIVFALVIKNLLQILRNIE